MVWGNDGDFSEFLVQSQVLYHLPSARPYSYACPDLSELPCRFVDVDLDVGVSCKGYCTGKAAHPTSTEFNMRRTHIW